jgi:hypothetical protein
MSDRRQLLVHACIYSLLLLNQLHHTPLHSLFLLEQACHFSSDALYLGLNAILTLLDRPPVLGFAIPAISQKAEFWSLWNRHP